MRNAWKVMAWARDAHTGHVGRKAVLMALAEYADESASCYPSQATLAEDTEQSTRTVRRQLIELEASGLIRREHRGNGHGGRTSDRYYLQVGLAANLAGNPVTGQIAGVSGQTEQGYRPPVADEQPLLEQPLEELTPSRDPLAGFDAFWSAYPRNTAKGTARTAWPGAVRAAGGEWLTIVAGAIRFAADPNRVAEFTPHPATWLRGERWADGPLPARGRANGKPAARSIINNVDTDRDGPGGRIDVTDL